MSKRIFKSPYPPLAPDDRTLPELIRGHPPDHAALLDGASGAATTYGELEQRVDRMARDPQLAGVVALWAPNSPEWAVAALGAMAAGATVTGIPPGVTEREADVQLADAGARLLMTRPPRAEALTALARRSPSWRCCPTRAAPQGCPRA